MRVFVAGATGAIGRELVPRLIAAGHEVTGMTRSPERAAEVEAAGAAPAVADAFDREAVARAVAGAQPEVVVNELTDIPRALDPRKYRQQMAGLARIRTEGYRNVADAARGAGARRLVAQSISFMYAPGAGPAAEGEPLWHEAVEPFAATLRATLAGEQSVLEAEGLDGLVLRYGWFYGRGTSFGAGGSQVAAVRARRYPIVGSGDGVWSFVHVADAADATVAAVEAEVTGILNVVDDEPAPVREWLPALAAAAGAKPPRRVPALVARMAAGRYAVQFATEQRGVANARAKTALGWTPQHPTWRDGFRASLATTGR